MKMGGTGSNVGRRTVTNLPIYRPIVQKVILVPTHPTNQIFLLDSRAMMSPPIPPNRVSYPKTKGIHTGQQNMKQCDANKTRTNEVSSNCRNIILLLLIISSSWHLLLVRISVLFAYLPLLLSAASDSFEKH
jgi:hypothetical protein